MGTWVFALSVGLGLPVPGKVGGRAALPPVAAACFGSVVTSSLLTPLDALRIRMQVAHTATHFPEKCRPGPPPREHPHPTHRGGVSD